VGHTQTFGTIHHFIRWNYCYQHILVVFIIFFLTPPPSWLNLFTELTNKLYKGHSSQTVFTLNLQFAFKRCAVMIWEPGFGPQRAKCGEEQVSCVCSSVLFNSSQWGVLVLLIFNRISPAIWLSVISEPCRPLSFCLSFSFLSSLCSVFHL